MSVLIDPISKVSEEVSGHLFENIFFKLTGKFFFAYKKVTIDENLK